MGDTTSLNRLKSDQDSGFAVEVIKDGQFLDNLLLRLSTVLRAGGRVESTLESEGNGPDIGSSEVPGCSANLLTLVEEGNHPDRLLVVDVVAEIDFVLLDVELGLPVRLLDIPALVFGLDVGSLDLGSRGGPVEPSAVTWGACGNWHRDLSLLDLIVGVGKFRSVSLVSVGIEDLHLCLFILVKNLDLLGERLTSD